MNQPFSREETNILISANVTSKLPEFILDCLIGIRPNVYSLSNVEFDDSIKLMSDNFILQGVFDIIKEGDIEDENLYKKVADYVFLEIKKYRQEK